MLETSITNLVAVPERRRDNDDVRLGGRCPDRHSRSHSCGVHTALDRAKRCRSIRRRTIVCHDEAHVLTVFSRGALGAALMVSLVGACAPILPKTPVQADRPTLQQLAGDWEGTYNSRETKRLGDITFHIRAGTDTAEGGVMIREFGTGDANPKRNSVAARAAARTPPVLAIRFVEVARNEVQGVLEPYPDPDCGWKTPSRRHHQPTPSRGSTGRAFHRR